MGINSHDSGEIRPLTGPFVPVKRDGTPYSALELATSFSADGTTPETSEGPQSLIQTAEVAALAPEHFDDDIVTGNPPHAPTQAEQIHSFFRHELKVHAPDAITAEPVTPAPAPVDPLAITQLGEMPVIVVNTTAERARRATTPPIQQIPGVIGRASVDLPVLVFPQAREPEAAAAPTSPQERVTARKKEFKEVDGVLLKLNTQIAIGRRLRDKGKPLPREGIIRLQEAKDETVNSIDYLVLTALPQLIADLRESGVVKLENNVDNRGFQLLRSEKPLPFSFLRQVSLVTVVQRPGDPKAAKGTVTGFKIKLLEKALANGASEIDLGFKENITVPKSPTINLEFRQPAPAHEAAHQVPTSHRFINQRHLLDRSLTVAELQQYALLLNELAKSLNIVIETAIAKTSRDAMPRGAAKTQSDTGEFDTFAELPPDAEVGDSVH